jgi:hypothetical protein
MWQLNRQLYLTHPKTTPKLQLQFGLKTGTNKMKAEACHRKKRRGSNKKPGRINLMFRRTFMTLVAQ